MWGIIKNHSIVVFHMMRTIMWYRYGDVIYEQHRGLDYGCRDVGCFCWEHKRRRQRERETRAGLRLLRLPFIAVAMVMEYVQYDAIYRSVALMMSSVRFDKNVCALNYCVQKLYEETVEVDCTKTTGIALNFAQEPLKCLKLMRKREKCPWDVSMWINCAMNRLVRCLKYAAKKKCPTSWNSCENKIYDKYNMDSPLQVKQDALRYNLPCKCNDGIGLEFFNYLCCIGFNFNGMSGENNIDRIINNLSRRNYTGRCWHSNAL